MSHRPGICSGDTEARGAWLTPSVLLVQPAADSVTAAVAAPVSEALFFWFKLGVLIYRGFLADIKNLSCSNGGVSLGPLNVCVVLVFFLMSSGSSTLHCVLNLSGFLHPLANQTFEFFHHTFRLPAFVNKHS